MLVYRIAKVDEIEKIFNFLGFESLGRNFQNNFKINNHQYDLGVRYLHFFKNYSDFIYLRHENNYFCTYDIDENILLKYKGIGYYLDAYFFRNMVEVCEYAIPSKLIGFENLVKVELVSRDIDAEELVSEISDAFVLKYKR